MQAEMPITAGMETKVPDSGAARAIITGGATSVGLATARKFHAAGRPVTICDLDPAALERARADLPGVEAIRLDVTDPQAVEAAFAAILTHGPVGVLVNAVGLGGPRAPLEEVSYADWRRTLDGSVGAAFYCAKQLIPAFKAQGAGVVINFSSSSTKTGLPNRTPYIVAKAGVEALTRNLARELGPFGIRVNAILPGAIDNDRLNALIAAGAAERDMAPEAFERHLLRFISMRSKISVEELADAVLYFASDSARHVTGQLLSVDGYAEWEE